MTLLDTRDGSTLFSLIVGTYGRDGAQLKPLLLSLLAQTDQAFEVIVVDQNSDDRISDALAAARGDGLVIKHVRSAVPNLSMARNIGIEHARGAIVGYPDDDCWFDADVIATARAAFARDAAISGVVGLWAENTTAQRRGAYRLNVDDWRRFRGGDAPSCALFFRAVTVRACDGFDVRLGAGRWFGASEDTDLILRMLSASERLEHVPEVVIHHPFAAAPRLSRPQLRRSRAYGRGIGALYAKHRLSYWVRFRGVVAPFVLSLRAPRPLEALVLAGATALGRLEGAIWWSRATDLPAVGDVVKAGPVAS